LGQSTKNTTHEEEPAEYRQKTLKRCKKFGLPAYPEYAMQEKIIGEIESFLCLPGKIIQSP
jgi:hypothetical protein